MDAQIWWYLNGDGDRIGPLSSSELLACVASARVTQRTRIWREAMPWWLPLEQVEDFEPLVADTKLSPLPA